jgi:hypothetical protein
MWAMILNCLIVGVVIAIGTFASLFAEMLIAADEQDKRDHRRQAQQQQF